MVHGAHLADALTSISNALDTIALTIKASVIQEVKTDLNPEPEGDKYLTGKQVDNILQISPPTRFKYANDGLLTRHKISPKKVLYLESEVLKLLQAKEAAE